ncbi:MAG: DNA replication/repair protein RecF [Candidatus Krumholzibacteria bacterium]|nr:DNA replication/repair protein RecF [Candidatus Krumholzibacteria bacterium]
MRFSRLRVEGFRNLQPDELTYHPGINWIYGHNGQGKTNFLEALSYVVSGRSFRRSRDEELPAFGQDHFFLQLHLEEDNGEVFSLTSSWSRTEGRRLRNNEQTIKNLSDLVSLVGTVIFGPDDVELVKGEPEHRRRYLDFTLSKTDPAYLRDLMAYRRVLRQRNQLLKVRGSEEEISIWTEKLVEHGSRILARRKSHLPALAEILSRSYREIDGNSPTIQLSYRSETEGLGEQELADSMRTRLAELRSSETLQRRTLAGPHRDDMLIDINGRNARKYASQGQKRSVAISLKLAQAEFLARLREDRPIVFLDDVFSELDPGRRERLCRLVGRQYQTFLATPRADSVPLELFPSLKRFSIQEGRLSQET